MRDLNEPMKDLGASEQANEKFLKIITQNNHFQVQSSNCFVYTSEGLKTRSEIISSLMVL